MIRLIACSTWIALTAFIGFEQAPEHFKPGPELGRQWRSHTSTALADGRVLLAGGEGAQSKFAQLVDARAERIVLTGALNDVRTAQHTATRLLDGRVLIAGGNQRLGEAGSAFKKLDSAELYDPITGTFTPTGTMTSARAGHAAVLLKDGKVLICGGSTGTFQPTNRVITAATAELYDPITGQFTVTGPMKFRRVAHSATLLQAGQALVTSSGTAELYDPLTGLFAPTGGPIASRTSHTATALADGNVLLIGGQSSNGTLETAELYDQHAGTFKAVGNMSRSRVSHTATLLPDGRVLVTGGTVERYATAETARLYATTTSGVEIFNPVSQVFATAQSLVEPRSMHAAVLLPVGVLITGGQSWANGAPAWPQHTSEIFTLKTGAAPTPAEQASRRRR